MPSGEYVCNACGTRIPADNIGVELMKAHLRTCKPKAEQQ